MSINNKKKAGEKSWKVVEKDEIDENEYMEQFAPALQKEHSDKYGSRVAAFRTTLEIVHEVRSPFPSVNPN